MFVGLLSAQADPVQTYVEAPGPLGPLKGTMLSPAAKDAPVVLIIPGSGPTDRDGNNPLGIKASTYRLIAEGLAEKGIATVRVDKRGMFASSAAVEDGNDVTMADYAADAHSWIDAIKRNVGAHCVWVLGHSEGGVVALVAAQNPAGLCGVLLVSTPGRPLGQVLREQLRANPANAPILEAADATISSLEAGQRVEESKIHPALQRLFAPAVQRFLISCLKLDTAKLLASYAGPALVVQGDKDLQVGVVDANRLKQADPNATLAVIPGANHVLKLVKSDSRGENIAAYSDPSLPLAPGVVDALAGFVLAHR